MATRDFYSDRPVPGYKWDEKPYYFVFYDGKTMHVAAYRPQLIEDVDLDRAVHPRGSSSTSTKPLAAGPDVRAVA